MDVSIKVGQNEFDSFMKSLKRKKKIVDITCFLDTFSIKVKQEK